MSDDYLQRAQTFEMAKKEDLVKALEDDRTVLLDVRNNQEISSSGSFKPPGHDYKNVPCTATEANELCAQANTLFPNKDAPIIVYCRSGRRASAALRALKEQGYNHVLNAGGYEDIVAMGL